ncbi:hypothetical protein EYZ11_009800 [Aspergillus tanneri]|uniref:RRM domain-containing protein n=1 Tax=Aspergillus tanneri TaxID=1220188 RepID=A0A4S3J6Z4_9EURO|nr:uncharacterized protein ATNIH1004_005997 [Aspergillus tanneri]KAA8647305.1 hypothetical protein ATNIH1004_005997 [Aspergillus tanneri]THC90733.1 hypothetical protein EYZ11_009800 [Aspergillus tanneri]
MVVYSVDGAMAEALNHLNRIACHFRKHEQHKAANELGKLSVMIVNAFSEGADQLSASDYAFDDVQDENCPGTMNSQSSIHSTLQKQAVADLMNQVEKVQKEKTSGQISALRKISRDGQAPHPGSWAQIAGTVASSASGLQVYCPETAQYMSPVSLTSASVSRQSQNSDDGSDPQLPDPPVVALSSTIVSEIPEAKAGVIRIYGRISKDVIQFITTRIHEGPLQDVRLETNGRTRVTFQHASQALAFLKSNQEMEQMLGFGRFGCGYHVELAEIIDWNEDLRRMNQPIRERRRLSFARKRLFAENMSPEKWKQDIRTLAGPGNIDFLWVFNSGNATAVFTSTSVARKVLEVFNRWKDGRNVYSGVSVTYSSDPCEKELVLVRDMSRPSMNNKNFMKRSMR